MCNSLSYKCALYHHYHRLCTKIWIILLAHTHILSTAVIIYWLDYISLIYCIILNMLKILSALHLCLSPYVQAVRSAVSDVWAVCPGPRSLLPSSSTWAWPCSVGVVTRRWAAPSPSSRTTLKSSEPREKRWMCSPCKWFVLPSFLRKIKGVLA